MGATRQGNSGGQRGIRTLEPRLEAAPLAGVWFRPTHPSVQARNEIISNKPNIVLKNQKLAIKKEKPSTRFLFWALKGSSNIFCISKLYFISVNTR